MLIWIVVAVLGASFAVSARLDPRKFRTGVYLFGALVLAAMATLTELVRLVERYSSRAAGWASVGILLLGLLVVVVLGDVSGLRTDGLHRLRLAVPDLGRAAVPDGRRNYRARGGPERNNGELVVGPATGPRPGDVPTIGGGRPGADHRGVGRTGDGRGDLRGAGDERVPDDSRVPVSAIILEDRSRNTSENLEYSHGLLAAHGIGGRVAVATSNYHAFRAALLMRHWNIKGFAVGSATALCYWPGATIREFVAILRDHLLVNLAALAVFCMPLVFFAVRSLTG